LLARNFSLLRKFLADTTALGIPFNVREVLLPLTSSLVRVGFGKHSDWDTFYRWIIDATHPYEYASTAPLSLLNEVVSRLDDLVRIETRLESRTHRDRPAYTPAFAVASNPDSPDVSADEFSAGYESLLAPYGVLAISRGNTPFPSARCKTCHQQP
jgi:hypothetical protein